VLKTYPHQALGLRIGTDVNSDLYPLRLQWQVTRLRLPLYLFNDDAGFWWENLEERDHLKEPGVNGKILKRIFKMWDRNMDWIVLARYTDRWRALVNAEWTFSSVK
jgi:hypothetical protein